jgi:hypothetical protein
MLPQLDTLHTIAEVGIAITGFAGIVAAVRSRTEASVPRSASDPLSLLIGTSLGTVFFCFVPEWLHAAVGSPDPVWRVSLGIFGVYRLAYIGLLFNLQRPDATSLLRRLSVAVGVSIGVLHVVAAAGLFAEFHYFLYLSGLLWGLVVALISFSALLQGPNATSRGA